ncbi:hypothetical protein FQR65_LT18805 [Abscondita terminalis]|nr:hypothetical protein FQR65_LT18805 [Abscondita terminalis]
MCVIKDTETVYNQIIKNSENSDFIKTLNLKDYHLTLKGCCKHVIKLLREEDIIKSMLSSQGSEDWKKLRQLRITGSRCYSLFTYKQDNWNLKADKYFWPKSFVSKFTEYGKKYEQNAMKAYKTRNKTYEVFVPGFVVCKLYPWFGYSPDGIVFENGHPIRLVEIKCPYTGKENDESTFIQNCDYLQRCGNDIQLKKNHTYYGQVQLGMVILNLKSTDLVLYSSASNNFLNIRIPFDEEFSTTFMNTLHDNYFNYMLHVYCENKVYH